MNVGLDKEHHNKLLLLVALWRRGRSTPQEFLQDRIDDCWRQLDEFVVKDLTQKDFQAMAACLQDLEV